MNDLSPAPVFQPLNPDAAGVLSWVHIGDLHMTQDGLQNHRDFRAILTEINQCFAGSISFIFLPGDIADDGSRSAFTVVRRTLDEVRAPWCAIIGDHDVHENSFANYLGSMAAETRYAFTAGGVRVFAMNAFDLPEPGSFTVLPEQLLWCEQQLMQASTEGLEKVLFLHCYPSELKAGGEQLAELIRGHGVRFVDMGHTHYNEVANDGHTLYSATRSTGQVEEGQVGFSVVNLDSGAVSWRSLELGALPAVIITSPMDVRLMSDSANLNAGGVDRLRVRAKVWADAEIKTVSADLGDRPVALREVSRSRVWEGWIETAGKSDGEYPLCVRAEDVDGRVGQDTIRTVFGARTALPFRQVRDRGNALEAWPEHGLLGTQLGPNQNGRKW